jgi:hypothetical protein
MLFFTSLSFASDQAKEKRWAEQIEDTLMDGESLMLKAPKSTFYALYSKAEQPKDTAVILLHGLGIHPDWAQVINPLRVALPEKGWTVLSLQLPILANGASGMEYVALYKDVPERINAGINYLKQQGIKKVVLVAHRGCESIRKMGKNTNFHNEETITYSVFFVGLYNFHQYFHSLSAWEQEVNDFCRLAKVLDKE